MTQKSDNVYWQATHVDRARREVILGQHGRLLWFTGLSGSGKSTVASAVEAALADAGRAVYLLDGDNIRHGLCGDLGFSAEDRKENIRRIGEVAKLMVDAGLIVLCAFVSPYRADRDRVRGLVGDGDFIEVFVDTPLEVCEARDVKGLYAKARAGELPGFTGISSPYEPPVNPEVVVATEGRSVAASAQVVLDYVGTLSSDGSSQ